MRLWTHKRYPIPRYHGWAMECVCYQYLEGKWFSYQEVLLNHAVECSYNAIQYNILYTGLQRLRQNLIRGWRSQKTPHTLPSRASYEVSSVRIWKNIDCVIMALHCIFFPQSKQAVTNAVPNINHESIWVRTDIPAGKNYWPFVRGIHRSLVDSPHKGPVMQNIEVFFIITINKLLNIQLSCWWFETPYNLCNCHCNATSQSKSRKLSCYN